MIDDSVLNARIPSLGTITTGRGTEATSQRGSTYSRPHRSDTLVVHTNDPEVADAVQVKLGGSVHTDSPHWDYDVVTDARTAEVHLLPAGFRQALELWRAAECVRRCDGVRMNTRDGRPTDEPCACAAEMQRGAERSCDPTTIMPVFVELPVERFGVFEVRSNAWGTASSLKGTIRALAMVGTTSGSVPAILAMVDRTVRDNTGEVRDVVELRATVARSHAALTRLAGGDVAASLPAGSQRTELVAEWTDLLGDVYRLGLRDRLATEWTQRFGTGRRLDDLADDELDGWVARVRELVETEQPAQRTERPLDAEAGPGRPEPADGSAEGDGDGSPRGGEGYAATPAPGDPF